MLQHIRLFLFLSLLFGLFVPIFLIFLSTEINRKPLILPKVSSYRGCITTLIRSDNLTSLNKVVNMLHSLTLYFKNIHRYPIYLFHGPSLTNDTKARILYCSLRLNITFYEINFNVSFQSNRSGYASMCQFWSYDLCFKYNIVQNHCDYVMRFDDDSYLINATPYDLFEEVHRRQLDYAYRIIYRDDNGLGFLQENLRSFLPANQTRHACIETMCTHLTGTQSYDGLAVYNNFFVIRLQLMYEHPIIKAYLEQLIAIKAFYRYRIGDANIQTICLLLIEKPLKISSLKFPYNHNAHGASDLYPSYVFYEQTAFMWNFMMRLPNATCRKLFIATKYWLIEKTLQKKIHNNKRNRLKFIRKVLLSGAASHVKASNADPGLHASEYCSAHLAWH